MSSLARTQQRQSLRPKFDRFTRAWRNEKMYQKHLIDSGAEVVEEKAEDGHKFKVIVNGDQRMNLLGKKPSYGVWLKAQTRIQEAEKLEALKVVSDKKVDVTSTDWEEK